MTAVDHAELKRLAEGAGGDAWGLNDWRPEGQILVCGGEGHSYGLFATVDDALPDVAAFIAAANPAVVLELLSEIEGLKAERDAYRDAAHLEAVDCDAAQAALGNIEAVAEAWSDRPEVQAMVEATTSVFAKWASPELLSRFRQNMMGVIQQAYMEGALRTQAPDSWRPDREAVASALSELRRVPAPLTDDGDVTSWSSLDDVAASIHAAQTHLERAVAIRNEGGE